MYAERPTERDLLAELREIHRNEHATTALRNRILAALPRSEASRGAPPSVSRSAPPWRIALAGAALIALACWALIRGQRAESVSIAAEGRKAPHVAPAAPPSHQRCPLEEVPTGALYDPQLLETFGAPAGASKVELATFAMPVPGCGSLIRRYLTYLPRSATARPAAPVLVVLHDSGDSAEGVRALQAQGTFEALADREGAIVVYANAGPGARTGRFPNSGGGKPIPAPTRSSTTRPISPA